MFHRQTKLFLSLVILILLSSCASYKSKMLLLNAASTQCQHSIIYQSIPLPKISLGIIHVAADSFLMSNEGYRKWALEIIEKSISLAKDPSTTYGDFASSILSSTSAINEWWGSAYLKPVIEIFSLFSQAGSENMDQCDRGFIINYGEERIKKLKNSPFA